MRFYLKFTEFAFIIGCTYFLANLDAANTNIELLEEKTTNKTPTIVQVIKNTMPPEIEKAIENTEYQKIFFEQGFSPDQPCVQKLIELAIRKDADSRIMDFLKKAASRRCIHKKYLQEICCNKQTNQKIIGIAAFLLGVEHEAKEQSSRVEILAFSSPITFLPKLEVLPQYLVAISQKSTLPLAEQLHILDIRNNLANEARLSESLKNLDTLLLYVQQIALCKHEQPELERAANLVDLVGKIRGIVPIIGEYLRSINNKSTAIIPEESKVITGYIYNTVEKLYSFPQQLKLLQLEARKNLAYNFYDALFNKSEIPNSVPKQTTNDPSPINQLAVWISKFHSNVLLTSNSVVGNVITGVVSSSGAIGDENPEELKELCEQTKEFASKILSVKNPNSKNFYSFKSLLEASEYLKNPGLEINSSELEADLII